MMRDEQRATRRCWRIAAAAIVAMSTLGLAATGATAINTSVCAQSSTFTCLQRFGYGTADTGTWAESYYRKGTANLNFHNCTRFAAFYMQRYLGIKDPGLSFGAAGNWGLSDAEGGDITRTSLKELGYAVDTTPTVGSIAWWKSGHVGVVIEVGAGWITVASDNYAGAGYADVSRRTSSGYYPTGFIHVEANSARSVYFVKTKNVTAVEVHTVTAASGYTTGISSKTRFSPADANNGWFGVLPNGDVYFVKTKNVTAVEVHTVTAASGYTTGISSKTRFSPADANNGWFGDL